jgi:hypothetical protein
MAHIIRLPVRLSPYPDLIDSLDPAERLLVLAVRSWVADYQAGNDPASRLLEAMSAAGVPDAAVSIGLFMTEAARTARRPITIQCPRCAALSDDEQRILHAASLVQHRASHLAVPMLRNALALSGTEFAVDLLESIGEMFIHAGLHLRVRQPPDDVTAAAEHWESWSPSASTIH